MANEKKKNETKEETGGVETPKIDAKEENPAVVEISHAQKIEMKKSQLVQECASAEAQEYGLKRHIEAKQKELDQLSKNLESVVEQRERLVSQIQVLEEVA